MPRRSAVPGLALCAAIALAAWILESLQRRLMGQAWLEALVMAIILGTVVRAVWEPPPLWQPGIDLSARQLLEIAVVLLGASVNVPLLIRAGPALAVGIVSVVAIGLSASYALSRAIGLNHRLALLVACGNSICGNSAIAAVAPVIDADPGEVASAISFTAALGVVAVVVLPLLGHALAYSPFQFGVLAGLSVYAVPQVLAVTLAAGPVSAQIGTLVKLVRVLMLGPVVVLLSVLRFRSGRAAAPPGRGPGHAPELPPLSRLVPWFIIGFLILAAVRSMGLIATPVVDAARGTATLFTVLAMAALGLGVDAKALRRAGAPVTAAVTLSLAVLVSASVLLIALLGVR